MSNPSDPRAESAPRTDSSTLPPPRPPEAAAALDRAGGAPLGRAIGLIAARGYRLRLLAASLASALVAFGPAATHADAGEPELAVRAEGYLGYSALDLFERFDAFQGGGAGSAALVLGDFYMQGDLFGDVIDFEGAGKAETVGPGLHLGWRDPERGSAGVVGVYTNLDPSDARLDAYRVGFESEAFLERFTLGLSGGYFDFEGFDGAYVDGLLGVYPLERARLDLRVGAWGFESGNPLVDFGAGAEFLVSDHFAPFVRWEAVVPDGFDVLLQHSLVAGLRVYWGSDAPTLRAYDRTYLKPSCGGVLFVGRIC